MPSRRWFILGLLLVGWGGGAPNWCAAADWHVNNVTGDDSFDGQVAEPHGNGVGPLHSWVRVLPRMTSGDRLVVANTGVIYYDSLQLTGPRFSGLGSKPFIIEGNGAVLSGARAIPPSVWSYRHAGLWEFPPRRKGYYGLLLDNKLLPEDRCSRHVAWPHLAPGHWCAWRGSFFYQEPTNEPSRFPELPLAIFGEDVGISLIDVSNVLIRDLTLQHFRVDGAHAHADARGVVFDNVRFLENGRAGLAVTGASLVGCRQCRFAGNRTAQIINGDTAQTELQVPEWGETGGTRLLQTGGHVLVDGVEVESVSPAQ